AMPSDVAASHRARASGPVARPWAVMARRPESFIAAASPAGSARRSNGSMVAKPRPASRAIVPGRSAASASRTAQSWTPMSRGRLIVRLLRSGAPRDTRILTAAAPARHPRGTPRERERYSRGALLVDLERPLGDLDEDPAVLDDHRVHRERLLGRRIEVVAGREVEPRQVQPARDRALGQESLVELEVFVAADPLVGADLTLGMYDEHLVHAVDPAHLHRPLGNLIDP